MVELYIIENSINHKVYIGTTSIGMKQRWYQHVSDYRNKTNNNPMYADMRKYGIENYSYKVLVTDISEDARDELEREYILRYNCIWPNGYNLQTGGISGFINNFIDSDSRSQKISQALSGVPKSEIHKLHLSQARIGKFTGQDNPFYGKTHSDVTKSIISTKISKGAVHMVEQNSDNIIMTFKNMSYAADYLISNGICKAKKSTCQGRLCQVIRGYERGLSAYGYRWKLDKVKRLSCTAEDELPLEAPSTVAYNSDDIV